MPVIQVVDLVHMTRRDPLETRRQEGSGCSTVPRSLYVLRARDQANIETRLGYVDTSLRASHRQNKTQGDVCGCHNPPLCRKFADCADSMPTRRSPQRSTESGPHQHLPTSTWQTESDRATSHPSMERAGGREPAISTPGRGDGSAHASVELGAASGGRSAEAGQLHPRDARPRAPSSRGPGTASTSSPSPWR